MLFTDSSFSVSVPVLSVQMTVVSPSVSTASRWRTSARRSAMRCAATTRERECGEQPLRDQGDSDTEHEDECIENRQSEEHRHREKEKTDTHSEHSDDSDQALQLACQRCRLTSWCRGEAGELSQAGVGSRRGHHGDRPPTSERGSCLDGVAWGGIDRNGLSGKGRNIHGDIDAFEEKNIGWDAVASFQDDDVTGDEFARVDDDLVAVATHGDS